VVEELIQGFDWGDGEVTTPSVLDSRLLGPSPSWTFCSYQVLATNRLHGKQDKTTHERDTGRRADSKRHWRGKVNSKS
jgi:hypothetical protein